MESLLAVKIVRNVSVKTYPFTNYFKGFEDVEAVKQLFGDETAKVLRNLSVEFYNGRGCMSFSDIEGHIRVNATYLKNGDGTDLYLDVIHELVHLKQFLEGKKIYSKNLIRVEMPLELEASRHAVAEARRLGLSDERIFEYLQTDRTREEDLKQLVKALNVRVEAPLKT